MPGLKSLTSLPTASMIPANSWPSVTGGWHGNSPRKRCLSVPQIPHASMRTRSSSERGRGFSASDRDKFPIACRNRAFILWPPLSPCARRRLRRPFHFQRNLSRYIWRRRAWSWAKRGEGTLPPASSRARPPFSISSNHGPASRSTILGFGEMGLGHGPNMGHEPACHDPDDAPEQHLGHPSQSLLCASQFRVLR